MAIASLRLAAPRPASAAVGDNMHVWLLADGISWIGVNSDDVPPAQCPGGACGSFGVRVDPATRQISGWAWAGSAGWVCFGNSCTAAMCANDPGDPNGATGTPAGAAPTASLDAGSGVVQARGWAKFCALKSKGWISLNCQDIGSCASGGFAYKVVYDHAARVFRTGVVSPPLNTSSLAWNGYNDNTGVGYLSFEWANLSGAEVCGNGADDDFNGFVDAADPVCATEGPAFGNCADGADNDLDGLTDCAEISCQAMPSCQENTGPNCGNGIDDDGDGVLDCADPGCVAFCPSSVESMCTDIVTGLPKTVAQCCSDGADNDANGPADCADSDCQAKEPTCTPAWLQTNFGNVYAQQGIKGDPNKPIEATYCLLSNGSVENYTSQSCGIDVPQTELSLPKPSVGTQGTLGGIDIAGIKAGRYGKVTTRTGFAGVPVDVTADVSGAPLNGKVVYVKGDAVLNATTFLNGTDYGVRGNGLLLVEGDLRIAGNLSYAPVPMGQAKALRNLASVGIVVVKTAAGTGGNLVVAPTVGNVVGTYFVENAVSTGTMCPGVAACPSEIPFSVSGLMVARRFDLQRNYRNPAIPAESFSFDGRGVANPPPGMQDVGRSLPASRDAF